MSCLTEKRVFMTKNTKEFSNRQETMVAKYMGWKVVAGSGARPFTPGDVFNEHFLVECKTHTEEQPKVVFYRDHWKKISEEARAKNRNPVLIVDNGTQRSQNTWVAMSLKSLPFENRNKLPGLTNTSREGTTIIFDNADTYATFKAEHQDDKINYFLEQFADLPDLLAIMTLEEFKEYYHQEFES